MDRATNLLERVVIGLLVGLVVVGGFIVIRSGSDDDRTTSTAAAGAGAGGGGSVSEGALPAAARATVRTVRAGGPFPNSDDGAVYPNRDERLPAQPAGFYHRYGVSGSTAVVQGQDGTLYYTADGRTFRQIRR